MGLDRVADFSACLLKHLDAVLRSTGIVVYTQGFAFLPHGGIGAVNPTGVQVILSFNTTSQPPLVAFILCHFARRYILFPLLHSCTPSFVFLRICSF